MDIDFHLGTFYTLIKYQGRHDDQFRSMMNQLSVAFTEKELEGVYRLSETITSQLRIKESTATEQIGGSMMIITEVVAFYILIIYILWLNPSKANKKMETLFLAEKIIPLSKGLKGLTGLSLLRWANLWVNPEQYQINPQKAKSKKHMVTSLSIISCMYLIQQGYLALFKNMFEEQLEIDIPPNFNFLYMMALNQGSGWLTTRTSTAVIRKLFIPEFQLPSKPSVTQFVLEPKRFLSLPSNLEITSDNRQFISGIVLMASFMVGYLT